MTRARHWFKTLRSAGTAVVPVAIVAACGSTVMIPPRIDLVEHEVVGVTEFTLSNPGELGPYATRQFIDAIRRDQGLVRIVELGPEDELTGSDGKMQFDPQLYREIGERYNLRTMFRGQLVVSDIRPSIRISPGFERMSVAADAEVGLSVQMIEVASGASIWSASSRARQRVGHVTLLDRDQVAFDANDPDEAYGELVGVLVDEVSTDFQVTWERR